MRFIMIDSRLRRVFDLATPHKFGDEFIGGMLRCAFPERVELTHDLDVWITGEAAKTTFRFFPDGPEFAGNGFLCGRSLTGDFKSLPRWLSFEAISIWMNWPEQRTFESLPRRRFQRPTGLPLAGLPLDTYHGIAPGSARENPYVMQMYG